MLDRTWLKKLMKKRGLSYYKLKRYHNFSPDTFSNWEKGMLARPASLKKLAAILTIDPREMVQHLGVKVMPTRTSHELTEK